MFVDVQLVDVLPVGVHVGVNLYFMGFFSNFFHNPFQALGEVISAPINLGASIAGTAIGGAVAAASPVLNNPTLMQLGGAVATGGVSSILGGLGGSGGILSGILGGGGASSSNAAGIVADGNGTIDVAPVEMSGTTSSGSFTFLQDTLFGGFSTGQVAAAVVAFFALKKRGQSKMIWFASAALLFWMGSKPSSSTSDLS